MNLGETYQDLIYHAAPLHDIGKLGIPDSLLLKNSQLTDDEFEVIKQHTVIGYEILNNFSSKYLKAGAVIAYSHHENFDGSGYPRGLSGDEILILGRIIAIIDVFDALTTKRPYKEAWNFADAFEFIDSQKRKKFEPALVDFFIDNESGVKIVFEESLSDAVNK